MLAYRRIAYHFQLRLGSLSASVRGTLHPYRWFQRVYVPRFDGRHSAHRATLEKEGILFDAFYTGYLGSVKQIAYVKDIISSMGKPGAKNH